ncbi:sulfatase-like hydrolase/transferase [Variovorax sp. M-6]|uniref:sulfatase-like hydrolase/transferase n=1 Tax=Variovorax sp. M-6 TaxID=3233041 RepID=UPI003F962018
MRAAQPWPGWGGWLLRFGLPFALLNALLTLENLWPTWWALPGLRLSFELCMAVAALTLLIRLRGFAGIGLLRALSILTVFWVATRYAEVTASAVFGRQIHLYWDGRHVFEVLRMGKAAGWQIALGAAALAIALAAVYAIVHRCWSMLARELAWRRPQPAIGLTAAALLAAFALQGIGGRDTRWFFSMPVAPIVARQAELLAGLWSPGHAASRLSASPAFDSALAGLGGADVLLIFAESYGASTLDDPRQAAWLAPHRAELARSLQAGGRQAVSARVRSPTFGGASWLAHSALLSGVDTRDPGDYELLLTTDRPTLVRQFKRHGYRTVSWMPGLQRPWPEGSFYGFDRYADARSIGYRGAAVGHWQVPDQASMALLHAQELALPPGRRAPRLVVFPTLASHAPFRPLAPYVSDWPRLLRADAYTPAEVADALAAPVSWLEPVPAYLESLAYTFRWLGDYLDGRAPPNMLTIVIGDHQPMASVSGRNASWEVPVHVISNDASLLKRLEAAGFTPGLLPMRAGAMDMHGLTPLLLAAFEGPAGGVPGAAE